MNTENLNVVYLIKMVNVRYNSAVIFDTVYADRASAESVVQKWRQYDIDCGIEKDFQYYILARIPVYHS